MLDQHVLGFAFSPDVRKSAMRWLKEHASYDDRHPWEALEIIATILGNHPAARDIAGVRSRIHRSYEYMRLALDECLQGQETYRASAA